MRTKQAPAEEQLRMQLLQNLLVLKKYFTVKKNIAGYLRQPASANER